MATCENNIVVTFYPDCSVQISDGQKRRRYYFDSIEVIDYEAQSITLAGNSSRVPINYEDLQIPNVDSFEKFVKWIQDLLESKNPLEKICSIENSLISVLACLEELKLINTDIELNTDDVATETTLTNIETLIGDVITALGDLATEATQQGIETLITNIDATLSSILTTVGTLGTEVTLASIETILTNTLTAIGNLATEATLANIETIVGTLATEATSLTISATLTSILTAIGGLATEATLVDVETLLTTITGQLTTATNSLSNIDASTANLEARLDSIIAILEGDVTADIVDAVVDGSTDVNVKAVSVLVLGTGATIDSISVPDNYSASWSNEHGGDVTNAIPYTVPTGAGSTGFQKIIITYNR